MAFHMSLLPGFTVRTITVVGGLVATGAAVIAEAISSDPTVGTGSFLLGGAGLIAAISAFTKDYWTDRQKQRDHEVSMLRLKLRSCRTCNALHELYNWARAAHAAVPALPAVPPDIRFDDNGEADPENRDA
jgi:hypothetical protein